MTKKKKNVSEERRKLGLIAYAKKDNGLKASDEEMQAVFLAALHGASPTSVSEDDLDWLIVKYESAKIEMALWDVAIRGLFCVKRDGETVRFLLRSDG
jgi:hypothetical protein